MPKETVTGAGMDLDAVRAKLAGATGRQLWRGLEEVADTPEFQELLHREFPQGASEWTSGVNRRDFLKLLAASLGLAGLTGCGSQPREGIVPYVKQPEGVIPGKTQQFASATLLGGFATGVLVTAHTGRPTKIEGNPDHPASLGSTDVFSQAAVLSLYDPDRAQTVTASGRIRTWSDFQAALAGEMKAVGALEGEGLRLLVPAVTSPTLLQQLTDLLAQFPKARCHAWEPIHRDRSRAGAKLAFGEPLDAHPRFDLAKVIVSIDDDFLGPGPQQVAATRAYSAQRKARKGGPELTRLYAVAGTPTLTHANADHGWVVRPGAIGKVAQAIAAGVGVSVPSVDVSKTFAEHAKWIAAVVKELTAARGTSVVTCGEAQPPEVHALVHAINDTLGNNGTTVTFTRPVDRIPAAPGKAAAGSYTESIAELVADMKADRVPMLIILGGNPVYTAPADLDFGRWLGRVRFKAQLSSYRDETAKLCDWHLPESHLLESWGDACAFDGTVTLIQPLTEPLYQSRTASEVVSMLAGKPVTGALDPLKDYWNNRYGGAEFDVFWQTALHDGVVPKTAAAEVKPKLGAGASGREMPYDELADKRYEVVFAPDPTMWDGRFSNIGWLQELPKPLSRLVWDNAALIAPATAQKLGVENGDVLQLRLGGRIVNAPVWILPGQAADAITLPLGYGRTQAGSLGTGCGFDANQLRTTLAPWFATGLEAALTGSKRKLVSTQTHWSMEGRDLVRVKSLEEFRKGAEHEHEHEEEEPTLYPPPDQSPNQWAMSIDLGSCTGCNACVVACQAENNIPVVGKAEVDRGRAMHWIRVDRYYEGSIDAPETHHQPVNCMHCENAPCEVVCPVNATTHSEEGLNEQTYNRCVGTRYCSNNCPYKVRRFNFFQYSNQTSPQLKMLQNPEVTVRARGVMEKCSYCVQRIDRARVAAKIEGRPIRDGEVQTACQTVCPAQAIVFGNKNDKTSAVAKVKEEPHNYGLLTELNTNPRTTYLAKVKNPNGDLAGRS